MSVNWCTSYSNDTIAPRTYGQCLSFSKKVYLSGVGSKEYIERSRELFAFGTITLEFASDLPTKPRSFKREENKGFDEEGLDEEDMVNALVNRVLFRPPPCERYEFPADVIRLKTSQGNTICAIYLVRSPKTTVTLLYSHENGEDLNTSFRHLKKLSSWLKVNVMAYDYSGYGESTGRLESRCGCVEAGVFNVFHPNGNSAAIGLTNFVLLPPFSVVPGVPSELNCYADISAVYDYLTKEKHIPPEHIILYGRSLGSGPSCYLAEEAACRGHDLAGLILHAAFASVYRIVMPDPGFTVIGDMFPNIDRIKCVNCPVFIAHGEADEIVPFKHAQDLLAAAPNRPKTMFFSRKQMLHNFLDYSIEADLMEAINDFMDYHVLARRLWMKPAVAKLYRLK